MELHGVSLAFGGLQAVEQVSFGVAAGAVKAVIGPNGAGKTTLFNLVTGFLSPQAGRIIFQGQEIQGRPAHWIARQGIARTFQLVQLFDHMTVLENVMVGRHRLSRAGLLAGAAQFPWTRDRRKAHPAPKPWRPWSSWGWPTGPISPPRCSPWDSSACWKSPGPWPPPPRLLLLDEPASGLDAVETERLQDLILELRRQGITILLVEHDMGLTMEVADEIAVLNYGKLIADGPPRAIQKNPEVIAAYLGTDWQG